jgi:hypothetical protein
MIAICAIAKQKGANRPFNVAEIVILWAVIDCGIFAASLALGGLVALVCSGAYRRCTLWSDRLGRVTAVVWLVIVTLVVFTLISTAFA